MAKKVDLVKNISQKLDYLSQEDAAYAVDSVLEYIQEELAKENRVEIRGFGSMSIRKRKYAGREDYYNTVYYRMSKNVEEDLKK
jgi:nucleoid DNA-binding protein